MPIRVDYEPTAVDDENRPPVLTSADDLAMLDLNPTWWVRAQPGLFKVGDGAVASFRALDVMPGQRDLRPGGTAKPGVVDVTLPSGKAFEFGASSARDNGYLITPAGSPILTSSTYTLFVVARAPADYTGLGMLIGNKAPLDSGSGFTGIQFGYGSTSLGRPKFMHRGTSNQAETASVVDYRDNAWRVYVAGCTPNATAGRLRLRINGAEAAVRNASVFDLSTVAGANELSLGGAVDTAGNRFKGQILCGGAFSGLDLTDGTKDAQLAALEAILMRAAGLAA